LALFAVLALCALPAVAQSLPRDFSGTWALKREWCRPGPDAPADQPRPFTLGPGRLKIDDMTCEFISMLPGGIMWRVEADCTAGTAKGKEFFVFSMMDQNLVWGWDTQTAPFTRCPE
jgi:hypothetical protein